VLKVLVYSKSYKKKIELEKKNKKVKKSDWWQVKSQMLDSLQLNTSQIAMQMIVLT